MLTALFLIAALQWGSTILGFISILVVIPPFIFYYYVRLLLDLTMPVHRALTVLPSSSSRFSCAAQGDYFRGRSKFAQAIAQERQQNNTYNPSKKQEAKIQHVENPA